MNSSRIDLLKYLHELNDELDHPPTPEEVSKRDRFKVKEYQSEFGSLQDALMRAGISVKRVAGNDESDEKEDSLIRELHRVAEDLHRRPNPSDMGKKGKFSPEDYREKFETWTNALVEAELIEFDFPETASESHRKYSDRELIVELWRMAELGGPPSIRDMEKFGKYSSSPYTYRYGSWNEALRQAGLQTREASVDPESRPKAEKHYSRKEWKELREHALERDERQCQECGMAQEEHKERYGVGLNVHHLEDVSDHQQPEEADVIENLETLCCICHGKQHPFASN